MRLEEISTSATTTATTVSIPADNPTNDKDITVQEANTYARRMIRLPASDASDALKTAFYDFHPELDIQLDEQLRPSQKILFHYNWLDWFEYTACAALSTAWLVVSAVATFVFMKWHALGHANMQIDGLAHFITTCGGTMNLFSYAGVGRLYFYNPFLQHIEERQIRRYLTLKQSIAEGSLSDSKAELLYQPPTVFLYYKQDKKWIRYLSWAVSIIALIPEAVLSQKTWDHYGRAAIDGLTQDEISLYDSGAVVFNTLLSYVPVAIAYLLYQWRYEEKHLHNQKRNLTYLVSAVFVINLIPFLLARTGIISSQNWGEGMKVISSVSAATIGIGASLGLLFLLRGYVNTNMQMFWIWLGNTKKRLQLWWDIKRGNQYPGTRIESIDVYDFKFEQMGSSLNLSRSVRHILAFIMLLGTYPLAKGVEMSDNSLFNALFWIPSVIATAYLWVDMYNSGFTKEPVQEYNHETQEWENKMNREAETGELRPVMKIADARMLLSVFCGLTSSMVFLAYYIMQVQKPLDLGFAESNNVAKEAFSSFNLWTVFVVVTGFLSALGPFLGEFRGSQQHAHHNLPAPNPPAPKEEQEEASGARCGMRCC